MTYVIRPSRVSDAISLAPRLRAEDKAEVLAAGRESVEESLALGVLVSRPCFTVEIDTLPQLIMGVTPSLDPLEGHVWMLASELPFTSHRIAFIRHSKAWVRKFHQHYPLLTNSVDARNTAHIEWLKWLGFSFLNITKGAGADRLPFYTFARIEHV